MVKGASNGGITDVDGVYSLMDVPGDAMISISYVGYKTVDIKVTDKSLARVILKEDTEMLDEVVVVGYGVQKKSDITGSVFREIRRIARSQYKYSAGSSGTRIGCCSTKHQW